MIRTALYDPDENAITVGGREQIETWQRGVDSILWLDLEGENHDEEQAVFHAFDVHPLAVQDALRSRHPPKLEEFDDFLFMLLRGLDATTTNIDFGVIQLALFVGDRFLITRHAEPSTSVNHTWDNLSMEQMRTGPGSLVCRIANRLQRRYVEILLALEPRLDEIEQEMFQQPNDRQLAELTSY